MMLLLYSTITLAWVTFTVWTGRKCIADRIRKAGVERTLTAPPADQSQLQEGQ